jgi:hypothetical protein
MELDTNTLIGIIGVGVTIVVGILGWVISSARNVKKSNVIQVPGSNNTITANIGVGGFDSIEQRMNSTAADYIENHRLRQIDTKNFAFLEQGYQLALDLSALVLEKEYDVDKVPKLKTAFVCLQDDIRYSVKGFPLYLNIKKREIEDLAPMVKAYEKVMGETPEVYTKKGGPNVRWILLV